MQPKNIISGFLKFMLIGIVAAFTGLLSYSFWQWTFPPEQWYYAILGFGLTGGAAIVYLVELVWGQESSSLRRTIALVMMVVSVLGEVATAGYGIKLEILTRASATPTPEDFKFMTVAVQLLILFHFGALVAYFAGDTIGEMFEVATGMDLNRDGVIGKENKGSSNARSSDFPSIQTKSEPVDAPNQQGGTMQKPPTNYSLSQLSQKSGKSVADLKVMEDGFNSFNQWKEFVRTHYPDATGGNIGKMLGELKNPQMAERAGNNGRR